MLLGHVARETRTIILISGDRAFRANGNNTRELHPDLFRDISEACPGTQVVLCSDWKDFNECYVYPLMPRDPDVEASIRRGQWKGFSVAGFLSEHRDTVFAHIRERLEERARAAGYELTPTGTQLRPQDGVRCHSAHKVAGDRISVRFEVGWRGMVGHFIFHTSDKASSSTYSQVETQVVVSFVAVLEAKTGEMREYEIEEIQVREDRG